MAGVQNIPGMRDFFGKKLGGWVYSGLSHMSPIDLAAGETASKISTAAKSGGILGGASAALGAIRGAIKNRGEYGIGDWFRGRNIGEATTGLSESVRKMRVGMRVGLPSMVGIAGISGMISPGNPLDVLSRTGIQIGSTAAVAGVLGTQHYGLGAAYAAWGGLNMLNSGDQTGPF